MNRAKRNTAKHEKEAAASYFLLCLSNCELLGKHRQATSKAVQSDITEQEVFLITKILITQEDRSTPPAFAGLKKLWLPGERRPDKKRGRKAQLAYNTTWLAE